MFQPSKKAPITTTKLVIYTRYSAYTETTTSLFAVHVLNMEVGGPQWFVVVVAILDTLLGVALGLLASAFARTEFQAVQVHAGADFSAGHRLWAVRAASATA